MTNLDSTNRGANPDPDTALNADLTTLYRVAVPNMQLDLGRAPVGVSHRRPFVLRHWRPTLTLAAAAAAIVALALAPSIWGRSTTHVSAEEILQRTNAAAEGGAAVGDTPPYHLVATTETTGMTCTATASASGKAPAAASSEGDKANKADGDAVVCEPLGKETNSTEMWFADSQHFRNSQTYGVPGGAKTSTFGQAVNGDDAWIYLDDELGTRAAHGTADALGMIWGPGQPNRKSLAEVLGQYSQDGCQSAREAGDATVVGRSAYVIEVRQTPDTCALGGPDGVAKRLAQGVAEETMTVWVDRETFLPLKTENRDGDGALIYGYYVTEIQIGADVPTTSFAYQPPAGARVTEVTTPIDAKRALSGEDDAVPDSGPGGASDSPEGDQKQPIEDPNGGKSQDGYAKPIAQ